MKILEIGSGTGYVLALLSEIIPNAKIIGIEIKETLAKSSQNLLKNLNKNTSFFQSKQISKEIFFFVLVLLMSEITPT